MMDSDLLQTGPGWLRIHTPAKLNLFLAVTGRRPDGYHDLLSLMCPVSLFDTLSLSFGGSRVSLSCAHPLIPEDETNLAWRAAALFFDRTGIGDGVSIDLEKRIPVGAGLGGGSSDAAAVLSGLNQYYGAPLPRNILMEMALSLGADVPFFLFGGPALATGVGEKLSPWSGLPSLSALLIAFDFSVSTAEVYKNLNLGLTKCEKINKDYPLENRKFDVMRHLCNDLETVTASKYPDISAAKKALMDHGAEGALMSGSGPTVFGLFSDPEQAAAAAEGISGKTGWTLYLADLLIQRKSVSS